MVLAYVSAIQDISLSPVLMSGAGTSMPGPGEERRGGQGVEKWKGCYVSVSWEVMNLPFIAWHDKSDVCGHLIGFGSQIRFQLWFLSSLFHWLWHWTGYGGSGRAMLSVLVSYMCPWGSHILEQEPKTEAGVQGGHGQGGRGDLSDTWLLLHGLRETPLINTGGHLLGSIVGRERGEDDFLSTDRQWQASGCVKICLQGTKNKKTAPRLCASIWQTVSSLLAAFHLNT